MDNNSLSNEEKLNKFVELGIHEREEGDVNLSFQLFEDALKIADSLRERLFVKNHIGLSYLHIGEFGKAESIWEYVLNLTTEVLKDEDIKIVALRNLSRVDLCSKDRADLFRSLDMAVEALDTAKKLKRNDLVWFFHGVFSLQHVLGLNVEKRKTLKLEKKELLRVWKTTNKLERRVWLSGLLMDYACLYGVVSKPFLYTGKIILKVLNLKRREEQVTRLIKSL